MEEQLDPLLESKLSLDADESPESPLSLLDESSFSLLEESHRSLLDRSPLPPLSRESLESLLESLPEELEGISCW